MQQLVAVPSGGGKDATIEWMRWWAVGFGSLMGVLAACASDNPAFDELADGSAEVGPAPAATGDDATSAMSSGDPRVTTTDGGADTGSGAESGGQVTSSGDPSSCDGAPSDPLRVLVSDKTTGELPPKGGSCTGARGWQVAEFEMAGDKIHVEDCSVCPCEAPPITIDFLGTASLPQLSGCGEVVVFEDVGPAGDCVYAAVLIFIDDGASAAPTFLITGSQRSFHNQLASPSLGVQPDCDYDPICGSAEAAGPYRLDFAGTQIDPGLEELVDFGGGAVYQVYNRESYVDDECSVHAGWKALKL